MILGSQMNQIEPYWTHKGPNRPWPGPVPWAWLLGFGALLLGFGALLLGLGALLLRLGALLLRLGAWAMWDPGHVRPRAMWGHVGPGATKEYIALTLL